MSPFWRNWLNLWCASVLLFGLLLAAGAFETTSGPARLVFTLIGRPLPPELDPFHHFLLALVGAVSIGWALTLFSAVRAASTSPAPSQLWTGLTAAVVIWFVIDNGLSIATGFPGNVVPNTLLLAGFLIPVWRAGLLRA